MTVHRCKYINAQSTYYCLLKQITSRLLTPEHSISLQNSIGSDIIMQLDDVIATTSPDMQRMKEAMERSIRWLDRCIAAHKFPEKQNLFCIIQGGLDLDLRKACCEEMVRRDTPGIAIGGLSGGENKESYCKVSVMGSGWRDFGPFLKHFLGWMHAPTVCPKKNLATSWELGILKIS